MSSKNKLDSKSKLIIIGIFAALIFLTFSAVMLIAAYTYDSGASKPVSSSAGTQENVTVPSTENITTTNSQSVTTTIPGQQSEVNQNSPETTAQEELISVEGFEEFTKTGDNLISDSPNNEFINFIVQKKGVDAKNLVAIYAVPDLGNNFVLEFDNEYDDNGELIRSPKTLKRIYHINKSREITVATGKATGNEGVDYGTSIMTYYLVTDVVMPEYPDYFTDVG